MSITPIEAEKLRSMKNNDGLVIQGCGGDLRQSDDGERFGFIEKSVTVNHGGSVITKEPIDLGEKGFISLTDDSEPNFIGVTSTFTEFMSNGDCYSMEETEGLGMEMT